MKNNDAKNEISTMLSNYVLFLKRIVEFAERMESTAHPEDAHEASSIKRCASFYIASKQAIVDNLNSTMKA